MRFNKYSQTLSNHFYTKRQSGQFKVGRNEFLSHGNQLPDAARDGVYIITNRKFA